jgi:hypothetical protein
LDVKIGGAWQGLESRYRGRDLSSTFFWGCPFFFTLFSCGFGMGLWHDNHSSGNTESTQTFLTYGIPKRSGVFPDAIAGLAAILGEKRPALYANLTPLG